MKIIGYCCNLCETEDESKGLVGISYNMGKVKLHSDLRETEYHVCGDCEAKLLLLFSERRRASLPEADARKGLTGAALILNERERQIRDRGYTDEHDDAHDKGELAQAAAHLAVPRTPEKINIVPWPFDEGPSKDCSRIEELIKAGALIAAEIDRLLRMKKGTEKGSEK